MLQTGCDGKPEPKKAEMTGDAEPITPPFRTPPVVPAPRYQPEDTFSRLSLPKKSEDEAESIEQDTKEENASIAVEPESSVHEKSFIGTASSERLNGCLGSISPLPI